jgi:hypothetical protein
MGDGPIVTHHWSDPWGKSALQRTLNARKGPGRSPVTARTPYGLLFGLGLHLLLLLRQARVV